MASAWFDGSVNARMYEDRIEVIRWRWDSPPFSLRNVFESKEDEITDLVIVVNGTVIDAPPVLFDTHRRFFAVQGLLVPSVPIFEALGYSVNNVIFFNEYHEEIWHEWIPPNDEVRHWSNRFDVFNWPIDIVQNNNGNIVMKNYMFLHVVVDGVEYIQLDRAFDAVIRNGEVLINSRGMTK